MNTDPKSELSQLVQRRKIDFPKYSLIERAGPSHNLKFLCGVEVDGEIYIGEDFKCSLKKAQQEAARVCLSSITGANATSSTGTSSIDNEELIQFLLGTKPCYEYVYYIDIENVSHLTQHDINQIRNFPTTNRVVVVSSILANTKLRKMSDIITPSSRENAADIDIIMRVTTESVNTTHDDIVYVIVSRDKIFYTFMELQDGKVEILSL